ncbi:hypothetical protein AKJ09_09984 [Labilithrix luteola]|uniref:Lipoprotein n=1 Tax=Labilithrix luteola TaxID=1391654 RepID=A0A0K1QC14_9BACT|nr:hypothetical protein [Labilithrix luteola]AKV03321.1 hypothetical protein AKJ09_09984 [Labilithrix luteola]
MKTLRSASFITLAGLAGLLLVGCDGGERREAEAVTQVVERFRRADNREKPAAVEALRAAKCSTPDVCHARDICLASAEPTSKALRLSSEVEQGLSAVERDAMPRDSAEAKALPGKLDEAESLLKEGEKAMPACADAMMDLKRKYRL